MGMLIYYDFSIILLNYIFCFVSSYKMNIWDVGGQKSLRSYWRNYFESTDGLIWVVDSADRRRMKDCKQELDDLLVEEVNYVQLFYLYLYYIKITLKIY